MKTHVTANFSVAVGQIRREVILRLLIMPGLSGSARGDV